LANYGNSSIVVFGIHEDGSLGVPLGMLECKGSGPDAVRQTRSHPHSVTFDPTGRFIAAADLGTDQVMILTLETTGLTLIDATREAPGSGPRQVAFHPDGKNLYVVNEIAGSVSVFKFDPGTGKLGGQIQTISTLPDDFPANGNKNAAGIAIHPSGKFLYVSNRKTEDHPMADSIAAYRIDQVTGRLTLVDFTYEGVACPRTIHFDLNGRWLYVLNQKGDSIIQYAIRPETGELIPAGVTTEIKVPVCIAFKQ
jgi:6-phosphogluconolactonase (cycloisomerase 2 family)